MDDLLTTQLSRIDVPALSAAWEKAQPTHFFSMDDFLDPDFAREVAAAFPDYASAVARADAGAGKRFERVNEDVKVQITDASQFAEPVQRLNRLLASREFIDVLERVTGIPKLLPDPELHGAGMHIMGPGGNLGVHLDFNYLRKANLWRRVNLLVYLTPDWDPSWGGEFDLWDPDVKECVEVFAPRFNRCAAFNTTTESFHGVRAIRCPDGVTRNSFAVFYYTEQPPSAFEGRAFSTIYRARPGEWWKRWVQMPIEAMRKALPRARRALRPALLPVLRGLGLR
jgi:Rps23 Pro-64 3,4-dihydroxylase Tpa1-like proline 4-hydroxylase